MDIIWQLDLDGQLGGRQHASQSALTGLGSHSEGDLISGTVAAAAYCCDIGPVHQLRLLGALTS